MTIFVIHAVVLILYGMIVWNSVQQGRQAQGRQAARRDDRDPGAHRADGTAQTDEGPLGN
jgi:hypothetical protein